MIRETLSLDMVRVYRSGVIVSSDSTEKAMLCREFRGLLDRERMSAESSSFSSVNEGRIAVTIVALHTAVSTSVSLSQYP